jgi:uncharacterized protein (DUF2336 family)
MGEVNSIGLDVSVFTGVIDIGDVDARLTLARQLVALVADPTTPDIEREQVTPVLLKLSVDPAVEVRKVLAEELALEPLLHPDVAFSIVADDDAIALPFLAQTPALNNWHQIAILRVGDEARQSTVAMRVDLSAEAADYVIKSSPLNVALALFNNPQIIFEAADYHTLYQRFGQNAEMCERLLSKSDLPLDIRILQARRTALRMRTLMAEKGWIPANDAVELVADAEDKAVMQVLIEASPKERANVTNFMAAKNMLTPALIVRAAATGQMMVVEAALAHLAGITAQRASEQMYSRSALGFKSIFKRSGLPMSCFGILRAACDVVIDMREEGSELSASEFGGRVLEALMTRYEAMGSADRAKQIEYLGRYGEDRIRKVAKRLKADLVRAA